MSMPVTLFGHRVLDLDAGVHLDEVKLAAVHIHQELDGARAFIIDILADALGHLADFLALACVR